MSTFGIMDPAFFVGRKELLAWINGFLDLDYTKVEQMASGAAYVQLMDAAFPGQIPLSKVNYNARFDYEFSSNFKILQNHFVKIKCDKVVPVDRLIKAKYQDNLEFMQWMKRWFEIQYSGEPYDAKARRKECKCEYASDKNSSSKSSTSTSSTLTAKSSTSTSSSSSSTTKTPAAASAADRRASMMPGTGTSTKAPRASIAPSSMKMARPSTTASRSNPDSKVEELTKKCAELTIDVAKLETTRDFYYNKLREIENLLGNVESATETVDGLKDKISNILFSDGS